MPIIVLGAHRSGTSALTRILNLMGASVGREEALIGSNEENPKGFWERRDVIAANDAALASLGCAWDRPEAWDPARIPEAAAAAFRQSMGAIIAELDEGRPWAMKDPRLCLTLPLLAPLLAEPVYVIAFRAPGEVAVSLHTRNGIPLFCGLSLWEAYTVSLLNAARGAKTVFVHYERLVAAPLETARELLESLLRLGVSGLRLPPEAMIRDFIDPALVRSRDADESSFSTIVRLLPFARGEKFADAPLAVSSAAQDMLRRYGAWRDAEAARDQLYADMRTLHGELHLEGAPECERMVAQIRHMHGLIAERDRRIVILEDLADQQLRYFQQLNDCVDKLERSASWRLGNGIVKRAKSALGKPLGDGDAIAACRKIIKAAEQ